MSNVGTPGTRLRGIRGFMANEASCLGGRAASVRPWTFIDLLHPPHYHLKVKLELNPILNNNLIFNLSLNLNLIHILTNTNNNSLPTVVPQDIMNTVSIHAQQALNGAIPPRHTFERSSSSRNIFSSMRDSRRCAAQSRRASVASSVDSTKSNKDAKSSKDPTDKKIKLPTVIMPTFRFVI
ncbi:hypothetical protein E4U19_003131 [Claviceps sp. Clav32 group G5]|nr:hypothetical protein E4U19_003131 [Claviceps sp. Clav32 group G5]KAG6049508.1 hypothetical protein E4U39_006001 [Claviceps sp. Clav50 group G5]